MEVGFANFPPDSFVCLSVPFALWQRSFSVFFHISNRAVESFPTGVRRPPDQVHPGRGEGHDGAGRKDRAKAMRVQVSWNTKLFHVHSSF